MNNANAITVIYNNGNKEVYSVSERDDTVVPSGHTKANLPGDFSNYVFQKNPTNYKYIDGSFVLNIKKISDEILAQEEIAEIAVEEEIVADRMRNNAIEELEAEGKVFKHIRKK